MPENAQQTDVSKHLASGRIALIQQQLERGFVWLRFTPRLERQFKQHSNTAGRVNRVALLLIPAIVLLASPLLDTAFFGVPEAAAWWSRVLLIGTLVPILAASLWWCLRHPESPATEWVIAGQFVAVCVGLLANHVILARYGAEFPIEFVGIAFIAVTALGRVRSWLIIPALVAVAAATLGVEILLVSPDPAGYYHLAAAGVLALFSVYLQYSSDYLFRAAWLDRQLLQLIARRDGLTGLLNRHTLESTLANAHALAIREHRSYGLAMVDIDKFGAYNNRYGHPAGDQALRDVGEVIEEHARRPLDVCGRYGGEEFVTLWMDSRPARIEAHAEGLRAAIEAGAIEHAASDVAPVVTVSIGLCHVSDPQREDSLAGVLAQADELLYRAKAEGRNRVVVGHYDRSSPQAREHGAP